MKFTWALLVCLVGFVIVSAGPAAAQEKWIEPGPPIDFKPLAMFPHRWEQQGFSTQLIPWEGQRVVFLTTSADFDKRVMTRLVGRLDAGWRYYEEITGRRPRTLRQFHGKTTMAAVPSMKLTCGLGCGMIGATGIEFAGFYNHDYRKMSRDPEVFPHYFFYEMGRNYYTFGDRHSLFITGFAVFMRYVCMDRFHLKDADLATRRTIEKCEAAYAASDVTFLDAFTNFGHGKNSPEKSNRLKDEHGKTIYPSDQPVMYATAMLKLRRDYGGDAWVKQFFTQLARCPAVKPNTEKAALRQCLNWVVSASAAAGKDLTSIFVDRWRMPMSEGVRKTLEKVDWKRGDLDAGAVIASLPPEN